MISTPPNVALHERMESTSMLLTRCPVVISNTQIACSFLFFFHFRPLFRPLFRFRPLHSRGPLERASHLVFGGKAVEERLIFSFSKVTS